MDGAWEPGSAAGPRRRTATPLPCATYLVVNPLASTPVAPGQRPYGPHDQRCARHRTASAACLDQVAYVTFQELATRVSHRSTGKVCDDPIADRMAGARIAADENLHMVFYRNITGAAFGIAPRPNHCKP